MTPIPSQQTTKPIIKPDTLLPIPDSPRFCHNAHVFRPLVSGHGKILTEAAGTSGTKVNFQVDEGPKARIGEIQFEGNKVFSDGKLKGRMKDTKERGMFSWITRKDDFEKEK